MANTTRSNLIANNTSTTAGTEDIVVTPKPQQITPAPLTSGTSNPDDLLKSWKPLPNILSSWYQPTYFFSFYLDNDLTAKQGQGNEFVIAETGLTGMNIQEVNIDTFVGPNLRTKNATATSIEIKIYEPYGSQLPDLLYQAAVTQGVCNYLKAPWFLKLRFKGYDDNGNPVDTGPWIWQLTLLNIQSHISEAGSMHTITALPIAEQALSNQYCMISNNMNVSGTTVGTALQTLIKQMNDAVNGVYGKTNPPFIEYVIKDEPYPYDMKVGVKNPFDHSLVSTVQTVQNLRSNDDYGQFNSQFSSGTDIPSIVDILMSKTDTAVQIARVSRELPPDSGIDDEPTVRDVASFSHRVETTVEYMAYNYVLGDYCRRITYVVKPYSSLRVLTSSGKAMNFDKEKSLTKKRAAHAIDRFFMKKIYNYIFTGLNTEVERYDIQVNFNWAVHFPLLASPNSQGTSLQIKDVSSGLKVAANAQAQAAAAAASVDTARTNLATASSKYNADQAANASQATLAADQAAIAAATTAVGQAQNTSNALSSQAAKLEDAANAKAAAAAKARKLPPTPARGAGEDTVYENAVTGGNGFGGATDGNQSYLPITVLQDSDNPSTNVQKGSSTDNNKNKSIYGALLNQLYGTIDGNLQALQLEIKGDPYWLGPTNTSNVIYSTPSSDTAPNYMNGEHIFVFRFKLPLGINPATGSTNVNSGSESNNRNGDSNIITGFYATSQVTNHFREGKFTQTLNGTRIPGWYYDAILEGRDINADETNKYSNGQAPHSTTHKASSSGGTSRVTSLTDVQLLAATLMAEAGNQGVAGEQAVGNVILNRIKTGRGPGSTISTVILAQSQFSCWNGVDPTTYFNNNANTPAMQQALSVAKQLINGQVSDNTNGATSYYNPAIASPSWGNSGTVTAYIGAHKFLKGV